MWRDETFLQQFALNVHTALDYFSRSPFYAPGCNNDECKRQGLPLTALQCAPTSTLPTDAATMRVDIQLWIAAARAAPVLRLCCFRH